MGDVAECAGGVRWIGREAMAMDRPRPADYLAAASHPETGEDLLGRLARWLYTFVRRTCSVSCARPLAALPGASARMHLGAAPPRPAAGAEPLAAQRANSVARDSRTTVMRIWPG
jgi:hypothetical protein